MENVWVNHVSAASSRSKFLGRRPGFWFSLALGSWLSILAFPCLLAAAKDDPLEDGSQELSQLPPPSVGEGPFDQLILRGVILLDGTGAPPRGPVDVEIVRQRIERIVPSSPAEGRPLLLAGGRELDLTDHVLMPGFVDLAALPTSSAEMAWKLSLGHGITTVRGPECGPDIEACLRQKEAIDRNELPGPALVPFLALGREGGLDPTASAGAARDRVAEGAQAGAAGVEACGLSTSAREAALAEAGRQGLKVACRLRVESTLAYSALDAAAQGAGLLEGWYGLALALLQDEPYAPLAVDLALQDGVSRRRQVGQLCLHLAPPGSAHWRKVVDALAASDSTLVASLNELEPWQEGAFSFVDRWRPFYSLESAPIPEASSRRSQWTSKDEAHWHRCGQLWGTLLRDVVRAGGRVAIGSGSAPEGVTGISFLRELELLQRAGLHPLEILRAATLSGAEALGEGVLFGSVEPGKRADLLVLRQRPWDDLKAFYSGTLEPGVDGGLKLGTGGVLYTLRAGALFRAPELLADVRAMVSEVSRRR